MVNGINNKTPLSPFGQFVMDLKGFILIDNRTGEEVHKWEAFDLSRKSSQDIIAGQCNRIKAHVDHEFLNR